MSPGLPNSWLNFRAQSSVVLRLVYWQQKKHLLPCLPFLLCRSCNPNTLEGAPHSKIRTCPLTWVKKPHVFKHSFLREVQGSGQMSAPTLLMCYHSFLQLLPATPIPLGLESRACTHCEPMAVQPAAGLLSPSRQSTKPPLPSSWPGSREEAAIPINHKPCWLNPSSSFAQLQPGVKAVL